MSTKIPSIKAIKKYLYGLTISVAFALAAALAVAAAQTLYINDADSAFSGAITDAYAVGADGIAQISTARAYALSADGLVSLDGEESGDGEGGGGLRYDDGSVAVAAERLKVGLYYYYSAGRDTSLEFANLENSIGEGYAFGYIDADREFVQFSEDAVTEETQITMRPIEDGSVGVYITGTDELLWVLDAAGKDNYLAVRPLSEEGDALTWFKGRRYYGDFAYADLGNGKLTVVNIVDIEPYVMGVCAMEMGGGFPLEALKAQAVAARTYGMFYVHSETYTNRCGFDLTADTYSQAYIGYTDDKRVVEAVTATENEYLTYNGKIIEALYCAADGGETLDSERAFPGALPYLRGYPDPYERYKWDKGANGHRVGMSQWGAFAMAQYFDKDYKDILGFYYTAVGLSYGYT